MYIKKTSPGDNYEFSIIWLFYSTSCVTNAQSFPEVNCDVVTINASIFHNLFLILRTKLAVFVTVPLRALLWLEFSRRILFQREQEKNQLSMIRLFSSYVIHHECADSPPRLNAKLKMKRSVIVTVPLIYANELFCDQLTFTYWRTSC